MPDLLGVTNPVPGRETLNVNRGIPGTQVETSVQNVVDPSRVTRTDPKTDRQDNASLAGGEKLRYDSNFQTFVQRLNGTPEAMELLNAKLADQTTTQVTSGIKSGISEELQQLLQLLPDTQEGLAAFIKEQMQTGSRFGGPLFALLRNAYGATGSSGMQSDILRFLKAYSDYASTSHIEGNLMRSINGMTASMPAKWGEQLLGLAAKLENGIAMGDREGNLNLIQNEIIPFMSRYVRQTHDMGLSRAFLTMLILDTARYENGTESRVLQSFRQLGAYAVLREKLGSVDDAALLRMLKETDFVKASGDAGKFAQSFSELLQRGLRGTDGAEMQEVFRSVLSAMLLNESVYMPLNHYMIPLEWNGRMMFSEVWVDPNAEHREHTGRDESEPSLRFLLKMDIQGLGQLDMVLTSRSRQVDLAVYCQEKLSGFAPYIQRALTGILSDNGLMPGSVSVERMKASLTISEVFPKLFEGKGGFNVRI